MLKAAKFDIKKYSSYEEYSTQISVLQTGLQSVQGGVGFVMSQG